MRCGRKCHPRMVKRRQKKWANSHLTGANTTWRGQTTRLLIALWARSTRKTRWKARKTKPTLRSLHPQPPPSTITTQPCWATLMTMNKEEWWCAPACIWSLVLVCTAGPLDTGQQILTYHILNFLPMIIIFTLIYLVYPTKTLATAISKLAPYCLRGKPHTICCIRIKWYKIPVRNYQARNKTSGATMITYLFPALFDVYMVSCCMEAFLWRFFGPPTWAPSYWVFQSEATLQPASLPVRFDSDSYPIRVNSHTSKCMANKPHLVKDLHLNKDKGQVDGISNGLEIEGKGTFKFAITDIDGKTHTIKIPNSLYVPK